MSQYPFPIEPLGVGKVLDYSFKTYFKKFSAFAVFTLLINGIFTLVFAGLEQYYLLKSGLNTASILQAVQDIVKNPSDTQAMLNKLTELSQKMTPSWVGILSAAASLFIIPLVMGGIAYISTGYFLGEEHTSGEWFSLVRSKYKPLFVTFVCSIILMIGISLILLIALVFICVIFGLLTTLIPFIGILMFIALAAALAIAILFIAGVFSMTYAIVIRENLSGFSPLMRAFKIGFSKFWKTTGIFFVVSLITGILTGVITSAIAGISGATMNSTVILIASLIGEAVGLLVTPVVSIAMNYNYISARIEKEGYLASPASDGSNGTYPKDPGDQTPQAPSGPYGQSFNFNTYMKPAEPQTPPSDKPETDEPADKSSEPTSEPTSGNPDKKDDDSQGPELL